MNKMIDSRITRNEKKFNAMKKKNREYEQSGGRGVWWHKISEVKEFQGKCEIYNRTSKEIKQTVRNSEMKMKIWSDGTII